MPGRRMQSGLALYKQIIETQQREIAQMTAILERR
jgi:uncharacterized protein (DUF305 family)